MQITKQIDKQTLVDLIVTALEGGSNYWYMLGDQYIFPASVDETLCLTERIGHTLYDDERWGLPVYDVEYEGDYYEDLGGALGIVTNASCQKAFEIMSTDYPDVLGRIFEEQYDALDADIFFQLAVMGEVVYG